MNLLLAVWCRLLPAMSTQYNLFSLILDGGWINLFNQTIMMMMMILLRNKNILIYRVEEFDRFRVHDMALLLKLTDSLLHILTHTPD